MIEISSTSSKKDDKTKIKGRKKSVSTSRVSDPFSVSLQNSIKFEIQGTIEELLTDLEDQEKRFIEKQTIMELARYKAIVQHILKMALDEGFRTAVLKRSRTDRSDYLIVKKIDEKMEGIRDKITRADAFNLLKEIEEIRGLIFDLIY